MGDSYEKLAPVALARGKGAQAESLSVAGLEIRRKVWGPKSPQVASQLLNVAYFQEQQGDTGRAVVPLRESLAIAEATQPPTDLSIITAQRVLAIDLCASGAAVEGDSLVRAAIAHVPADPGQALPYRLQGVFGFCLTRQRRFAEAEGPLLAAEAGLRALGVASARFRSVTVGWLVSLYDQWGKSAEAATWRGKP